MVAFTSCTPVAIHRVQPVAGPRAGGTTVTVIALVDGATLLHAQVGDSSALLGGSFLPAAPSGAAEEQQE